MKPVTIASNCFNEIEQCEGWYKNMVQVADGGILIVDTGSDDGTLEFFKDKGAHFEVLESMKKKFDCFITANGNNNQLVVIIDDIVLRDGYGPARNHLRRMTAQFYPSSHWCLYLDFDERLLEEDYHKLRFLKDYLIPEYDVIALPRLNRLNKETRDTKVDYMVQPDFQCRMTRLSSHIQYIRKLHEQIIDYQKIYMEINNPKIHHFHRTTDQKKRDYIGKMCAKLHMEDDEYGSTYPLHHKEEYYRELLEKEGL